MSKNYKKPICNDADKKTLEHWSRSKTMEARMVERAKIILRCLKGIPVVQISKELHIRPNTVISWRKRFEEKGIDGLFDKPRSGKPKRYGENFRNQVLATLEKPPPDGQAVWDGPSIARHLGASADAVWRVLKKEGMSLIRQRSWCVSTDPEFASKAADIVGLDLNPPENAIVISVDEKPSIQALERSVGYVETSSGNIVRGFKSTYKRHGTLNLFAALEVATGIIKTELTKQKRRVEFLGFMDKIISDLPKDRELHVILDHYSIHKKNNDWLKNNPNVHFHFTPTSASWLNQVEIWFGLMSRKALRGASFKNVEELSKAISNFITAYNSNAKPFVWRKREVKGTQLRNTIVNLCN